MEPSSLFPAYVVQQAVQAPSSPLEPFEDISVEPSFLHGDIPVKSRAMVVLAEYLVNVMLLALLNRQLLFCWKL